MMTFQHQSDVRRVIMDEFDLPRASEILRQAKREADEAHEDAFSYASLVRRAERWLLYGDATEDD